MYGANLYVDHYYAVTKTNNIKTHLVNKCLMIPYTVITGDNVINTQ